METDHEGVFAPAQEYDDAETAEEVAASRRRHVVYSTPNTLQLDIDNTADWERFLKWFPRIHELDVTVVKHEVLKSRSGNRHVIIETKEVLQPTTRILIQALLGSDRSREFLNYRRVLDGMENPIRLFRPNPPHPDHQPDEELPFAGPFREDDELPF